MTLFLAGVRDEWEAEIAIANGADLLDLVDPAMRARGPAPELAKALVRAVAGRRSISALAGDAASSPEELMRIADELVEAGVDHVRVALERGAGGLELAALSPLASRVKLIGVFFAEMRLPFELIDSLAEAGFHGAMLDTTPKPGPRLLEICDLAVLWRFVDAARQKGMPAWLSGGLEPPDVPRLLPLRPDVLGFRGALSLGGDRGARIDPKAVALMRDLIAPDAARCETSAAEGASVDFRLLAGRMPGVEARDEICPPDRIFVRDLVLPVRVGAYRSEHQGRQRVRFSVEAHVARKVREPADMRDILSYDLITDSIRSIVAEAHFELVETLAERIAEQILGEPRVVRAVIRVEKLDTGPGSVGVEITRDRPGNCAALRHPRPAAGNENRSGLESQGEAK